ncbi:MAG: hypothetical protein SD837_20770 [Candidatus Electrothrix scaldis]|nr:MAG: hypothetical protein SD837_20770 [Candidatus Electrothrix sp. GW3-3]
MSSWILLFTERLTRCNPALEETFRLWFWPIGTCLGDKQLWWGKQKKRHTPHEGVDLAYYMDKKGRKQQVDPGLRIPTLFAGMAVQLHQDFLNWSVYIRHEQFCRDDAVLHTVYGHVQPNEGLDRGQEFGTGESVALLEEYAQSTAPVHLHFTIAWVPKDLPSQELSWQMLNEHEHITLVDPLAECEVELSS